MMEFLRSRYFPATLFAVGVHLLLVGLMVIGINWPERPRDFELRPIQLEFANLQEIVPIPIPQPPSLPDPLPVPEPVVEPVEDLQALALRRRQQEEEERLERERREREEQARRQAELQAERARQLEEERRENQRRAQEERERQQAEQRQREEQERLAEQQRREAERQQAEEQRRVQERARQEQERQQQAQAASQAQAERSQRLAEIAARGRGTDTGVVGGSENSTVEPGLAEMHQALIRRQIQQAWRLPPSARSGMRVVVNIRLLPTGELREVTILQSSGNAEFDRSALEAVRSVNRFNVPRDPIVFENVFRSLNLDFDPDGLRL